MTDVLDSRDVTQAAPSPAPSPTSEPEGGSPPRRRRWLWAVLGPVVAAGVYAALPAEGALSQQGRLTAAVVALMAVWWMTEALPLPVTSLLPIVAFPLLGVLDTGDATAPYAAPTVFLFMGGFVIALAMQRWGLHTRIALHTVRLAGTQPRRLVLGIMVATAGLSMWVSNTAAALMMLPIGLSVLALATGGRSEPAGATSTRRLRLADLDRNTRNFAVCIVLAIAYAATIGGLATLIGSPPTLVMSGFVRTRTASRSGSARGCCWACRWPRPSWWWPGCSSPGSPTARTCRRSPAVGRSYGPSWQRSVACPTASASSPPCSPSPRCCGSSASR